MKAALLSLLLVACVPPCHKDDKMLCARNAISLEMKISYENVLAKTQDITFEIGNEESFIAPNGMEVRGLAFCNSRHIRLNNEEAVGVLAHELIHIYFCPEEKQNYRHVGWQELGAYEAQATAAFMYSEAL